VTRGCPSSTPSARLDRPLEALPAARGSKFQYSIHQAIGRAAPGRQGSGPQGRCVRRGNQTDETRLRSRKGTWASLQATEARRKSSRSSSPNRAHGLEFWISNRSRDRDKGDDIHHKIGVITGKTRLADRHQPRPVAGRRGAGPSMKGIIDRLSRSTRSRTSI